MRLTAPVAALLVLGSSPLWPQRYTAPVCELALSPANLKALKEGDAATRRLVARYARVVPPSPLLVKLWKERAWPEGQEGWILRDFQGRVLNQGPGLLQTESLARLLNPRGEPQPWERMEAVLRAQEDHGEALVELLALDLKTELFGELGGETVRTLKRLQKLEDWPWQARIEDPKRGFDFLQGIRWYGPRVPIDGLMEDHLAALARDPEHPGLQGATALLLRYLRVEPGSALEQKVLEIQPLPGQAWPPLPLMRVCLDARLRLERFQDLVHACTTLERTPDRVWLTPAAWVDHCRRQAHLTAYRVLGEAKTRGLTTLPKGLDALHALAGEDYKDLAPWVVTLAHLNPKLDPDPEILALMQRKPRPIPPRPAPAPPWRIVLRRPEPLQDSLPLAPWSPGEVRVEVDPRLGPDRDWELWLGQETLAQGLGAPDPQRLAEHMRGVRPSRLDQATAAVERQPEAIGPRRFRLRVLQARLADRRLEPMLAEDARKALVPLDLGELKWDENLWFEHGKRAVADLEDHLRRWPLDAERWQALAFWSSFLPTHPGPAPLRASLPTWKGPLPLPIFAASPIQAAPEAPLKRLGRWDRLLAWADQAWEALQDVKPVDLKDVDANLGALVLAQRELALRGLGRTEEARQAALDGPKALQRLLTPWKVAQ